LASAPRYPIPAEEHRVEEEIMRSRFITTVAPAATIEEAQAFIESMRQSFPDATHNCWAYLVGPPGSSGRVGMSDDGEPHGTAGRPMLNVLSHAEVGDIAAVVTRFYGGTKLGKGGLVRAYSHGVQLALETLPTVEKIAYVSCVLIADYAQVTRLKRLLEAQQILIDEETYEMDANFKIRVPEDGRTEFEQAINDMDYGSVLMDWGD
jgi:uncharacterized YigZ family protein